MLLRALTSILFPEYCFSCRALGAYVCKICAKELAMEPRTIYLHGVAVKKRLCFFRYGGVFMKVLRGAKYFCVRQAIYELLRLLPSEPVRTGLAELSGNRGMNMIILPVPLNPRKQRERGFNQAEIIARYISSVTGVPSATDIVERSRYTLQQARLTKHERAKNIIGAFRVRHPKKIQNSAVVVVDDVWTTGSTVTELAKCLRDAGAREVYALTLAG